MTITQQMIEQVDRFLGDMRTAWMEATDDHKAVWMQRIDSELDARIVLMRRRNVDGVTQ